jgi:hypothetical protein
MQGIHTYIPDTNHVSRVHGVAAILRILLMILLLLLLLLLLPSLHYFEEAFKL